MDWNKIVGSISDEALSNLCMDAIKRINSNPNQSEYVVDQLLIVDACIGEIERREGGAHAN